MAYPVNRRGRDRAGRAQRLSAGLNGVSIGRWKAAGGEWFCLKIKGKSEIGRHSERSRSSGGEKDLALRVQAL